MNGPFLSKTEMNGPFITSVDPAPVLYRTTGPTWWYSAIAWL